MDNDELREIFKTLSFYDNLKLEAFKSGVTLDEFNNKLIEMPPDWWVSENICWCGSTIHWEDIVNKWHDFVKDGNYEHITEFLSEESREVIERNKSVRKNGYKVKLDFTL